MSLALSQVPRLFTFVGGDAGPWRVEHMHRVTGEPLSPASHVSVIAGPVEQRPARTSWLLRGITSNDRYVTRSERAAFISKQQDLGRSASTRAALIPIRKNMEWWALTQDERRQIFEEQSQHIATGLKYLPSVARRLHHCRDLGPDEPFDFLTWFEYAPEHESGFEELVQTLRASPEWNYVEREIDIRLMKV